MRRGLGLFLLAWAFFAASMESPGTLSADGVGMLATAESLATGRSLAISERDYGEYVGPDGQRYAKWPVGLSLAELPLVAAAIWLSPDGQSPDERRRGTSTAAIATSAALKGLLVVLMYLVCLELGCADHRAIVIAGLTAVGSPLWPTGQGFSEPLQAVAVAVWILGLLKLRPQPARRWLVTVSLGVTIAFLTKITLLLLLPLGAGFLVVVARTWTARPSSRDWLIAAVPLLAGCAVLSWTNAVKFGDPIAFGYSLGRDQLGFSTPWWLGAYGLWLSSGKSLLLYCPLLLAALPGWHQLWGRDRTLVVLVTTTAVAFTLLYGKWWAWHGDHSWGPRLLIPFVPVFLIGLVATPGRAAARAFVGACSAAAIVINLTAVILSPETYFRYAEAAVARGLAALGSASPSATATLSDQRHFVPTFSPVLFQACATQRWLELRVGTALPASCDGMAPWSRSSAGFATALDDADLVSNPMLLSGRTSERYALVMVVTMLAAAGLALCRRNAPRWDDGR